MKKIICLLYQSCLSKIVLSNGCDQSLKVNKRNILCWVGELNIVPFTFEKGFKNNSTYTECPQSSHLFPDPCNK